MDAGAPPALLAFTPPPEEFMPAKGTGDTGAAGTAAGAAAADGEAATEDAGAVLLAAGGDAAVALGDWVLKAEVRVSLSATP